MKKSVEFWFAIGSIIAFCLCLTLFILWLFYNLMILNPHLSLLGMLLSAALLGIVLWDIKKYGIKRPTRSALKGGR